MTGGSTALLYLLLLAVQVPCALAIRDEEKRFWEVRPGGKLWINSAKDGDDHKSSPESLAASASSMVDTQPWKAESLAASASPKGSLQLHESPAASSLVMANVTAPTYITKSVGSKKTRRFIIIDQKSGMGRRDPTSKKDDELVSEPCACFAAVTGSIEKWCTGADTIDTESISCGRHGADLLGAVNDAGRLAAGHVPPRYVNSQEVSVDGDYPGIAAIKAEIRAGRPVVIGVEQEYSSGGTGNHAIVVVGYTAASGTDPGLIVADPWGGEFAEVPDFPTGWDRRSTTKLPAGYSNWYITKVGFTSDC